MYNIKIQIGLPPLVNLLHCLSNWEEHSSIHTNIASFVPPRKTLITTKENGTLKRDFVNYMSHRGCEPNEKKWIKEL